MKKKSYVSPRAEVWHSLPKPQSILIEFSLVEEGEINGFEDFGEDIG